MSFCSWLYAVAFGISLAASTQAWSQTATEDQPGQEDSTTDTQASSENTYPDPIDFFPALKNIEAAIRDLIAKEDETEAYRKKDAESRDLDAQEQMAKWAYWMTLATIGGVVATFVGLGLIGKTLHHTKRAADYTRDMLGEAERATIVAEGAVDATRDIGEKQVRAYLHVKSFDFSMVGDKVLANLIVANAGQSPAVSAKASVTIADGKKKSVNLDIPLPNIAANSEIKRTLKSSSPIDVILNPDADIDAVRRLLASKRVTVYILVDAKDVFGRDIEATSMRPLGAEKGLVRDVVYEPDDAEGFFPDEVVRALAMKERSRD